MHISNLKRAMVLGAALTLMTSAANAQDATAPVEATPAPAAETPAEPIPAVPAEPAPVEATPAPATIAAPPVAPAKPAIAKLNPVDPPPEGMGQVVFFRPSRFSGGGVSFSVREGNTGVAKLTNGSYFVLVTEPGVKEYNISFETRDTLRMEVEEGETYYVIQAIGMGVIAARPNLTPSTEEAFQEKKLKLTKAKPTDRKD